MTDQPTRAPIEVINDMRARILQADALRAEGKTEEADAMSPTEEELREALIALRANRGKAVDNAAAKKTAKAAKALPLDLNDLFVPK